MGPAPQVPAPVPVPAQKVTEAYDCEAGFWNWQNGWSEEKKGWCCQNKQKACPGDPVPSAPAPVPPQACCMALIAECLACAAAQTVDQYCAENAATAGCPPKA